MKRISQKGIVCLAVAATAANALLANMAMSAQNYTALIAQVQSPNYNEDCVWFTLVGVPQADPILPNSPWFALPRTQIGYSEIYAILLAAKLSGSSLNVVTTGAAAGGACGAYAAIAYVVLQ
jgi:hypothetical protein